MSTTRLITVICWAISAVALLGLVIWFIVSTPVNFMFNFETGPFESVETHHVPVDGITSLQIANWTSGAVTVTTHDGSDIQITEFARGTLQDDDKLRLTIEEGAITINFTRRTAPRSNMPSKQLEVLVPYAYADRFESLIANTTSGRINVTGVSADDFSARTTSGNIVLRDIVSENLSVMATSGAVEVFGIYSPQINLQTVSGRVVAADTQAQSLTTTTTSGRHELSGSFENVNARSTSGRVEVTSTVVPESLNARTTSGNITVTVPDNAEPISVRYSVTSGRFTSAIPVVTHSADAQFNLNVTSGRISIYELR